MQGGMIGRRGGEQLNPEYFVQSRPSCARRTQKTAWIELFLRVLQGNLIPLKIPEGQGSILQPHWQEVTVRSHWTFSSPKQQAVLRCALKAHEKVVPWTRHPKKKTHLAVKQNINGWDIHISNIGQYRPFEDVSVVVSQVTSADKLRDLNGFSHSWEEKDLQLLHTTTRGKPQHVFSISGYARWLGMTLTSHQCCILSKWCSEQYRQYDS